MWSSIYGCKCNAMCIEFVPVTAVVAWTTGNTVPRVLQLRTSTTLPTHRLGAVIFPVRTTLLLCVIDALSSCAARWPSLRPELCSTRLCTDSTVCFSLSTPTFVALLWRAPLLRSFNMVFDGALSFTLIRVGQDGRMPRYELSAIKYVWSTAHLFLDPLAFRYMSPPACSHIIPAILLCVRDPDVSLSMIRLSNADMPWSTRSTVAADLGYHFVTVTVLRFTNCCMYILSVFVD